MPLPLCGKANPAESARRDSLNWLLGLLVGLVLASAIELGYLTANYFRIQEDANLKDQMVAIRDGLSTAQASTPVG